jgi:arylsulfatase A-like enzyme
LPKNFRPVMAAFDRQVGRLLDGLKSRGLEENTIVIFTSDNGALPTFQGSRSGGFRGNKLCLYEGGIRMPFIVRWPGKIPAGRVDDRAVFTALDVFPTLCALGGGALPGGHAFEGMDVSAVWIGGNAPVRGALFWEYGRNDEFFKFGPDRSPSLAVRRGQWKLLLNPDGSRQELYDLSADSKEANNLAVAQPEIARELAKIALDWRATWPKRP